MGPQGLGKRHDPVIVSDPEQNNPPSGTGFVHVLVLNLTPEQDSPVKQSLQELHEDQPPSVLTNPAAHITPTSSVWGPSGLIPVTQPLV